MPIVIAVTNVVSKPTAMPEMMFVAGPVLDASAISRTGPERAGGVVLRDVDERDARREAHEPGDEEVAPRSGCRPAPVCVPVDIITLVVMARPTTDRSVVTQYPRLRMFIGFSSSRPRMKNATAMIVARSPKARTTSGKKIQAAGFGQPACRAMA